MLIIINKLKHVRSMQDLIHRWPLLRGKLHSWLSRPWRHPPRRHHGSRVVSSGCWVVAGLTLLLLHHLVHLHGRVGLHGAHVHPRGVLKVSVLWSHHLMLLLLLLKLHHVHIAISLLVHHVVVLHNLQNKESQERSLW